ncbi:hypothetical protein HFP15_22880 [Amycolatopsis sp. K13G38]|uniref:Uncharacterized protein n=1 Tax=Amycolatopsis acididurans TaxID=2724524 RepID=A0ABX1JBD3_9PSEU|nr:hypothetical protein [Amycolatopsis acididurans]NKQ55726.1 hypothetical protein [Amycolatopsis acididurans]
MMGRAFPAPTGEQCRGVTAHGRGGVASHVRLGESTGADCGVTSRAGRAETSRASGGVTSQGRRAETSRAGDAERWSARRVVIRAGVTR